LGVHAGSIQYKLYIDKCNINTYYCVSSNNNTPAPIPYRRAFLNAFLNQLEKSLGRWREASIFMAQQSDLSFN
jgi:hypothetical protein